LNRLRCPHFAAAADASALGRCGRAATRRCARANSLNRAPVRKSLNRA
jgi:hypothetical protein